MYYNMLHKKVNPLCITSIQHSSDMVFTYYRVKRELIVGGPPRKIPLLEMAKFTTSSIIING